MLPGNRSLIHLLQTWILPGCPLRRLQAPELPLTEAFRRILAGVPYCGALLRLQFSYSILNFDPAKSGEIYGPPSRALYLVRLDTSGKSPGIAEGVVNEIHPLPFIP